LGNIIIITTLTKFLTIEKVDEYGHHDSLDHILVSQEFVRQNPRRLGYVEYVKVFNDHLIDQTLSHDKIPKWQSDHGQVVITM
jgi:hypothetical protein